ncbi:hypothetical protein F5I97DRAFT_1926499 [Phlebopus sp. FC_14]|nr:hypothetical protein F5I97DRAFT_1926499 [Phlebopus sp. FC_14]
MPRGIHRHRLPQRFDYHLIPAPLDLSLSVATEKSPLPAIIVTPSSPALDSPEYYIAFLSPPPKPSLRERIANSSLFWSQLPGKARTAIIISLLLFVLICHLLTHLAGHRPHFDFYKSPDHSPHSGVPASEHSIWNLVTFDLPSFWHSVDDDERRSFIIEDLSQAAHR